MYRDIIRYKLASGISEEHLFRTAEEVVKSWMGEQPGFISWEIHKTDDGYTDIVCWDSLEDAKRSEADMVNIPGSIDWISCYEPGSITSNGLQRIWGSRARE